MITELHPYYFLLPLFEKADAEFSLSRYIYTPDSLLDEREILTWRSADFSRKRIDDEIASLRSDQELAFHSRVSIKGKTVHVPMIDFSTSLPLNGVLFDRMSRYLPRAVRLNMAIFSSGRSYHAYSLTLLPPKEWLDFMGRLLLINGRDEIEIIDNRWIGHRLIGGFSSLRWSNNSGKYKGMPSRVGNPITAPQALEREIHAAR